MRSTKRVLGAWLMLSLGMLVGACSRGKAPANDEVPGSSPSTGEEAREVTPPEARGPECGRSTCQVGDVCCNASCGICTPPDGMCTQQVCVEEDPPEGDAQRITCANVRCASGTRCEMVEVQCVRAPCYPVPQCVPDGSNVEGSGVSCGKNTCAPGQECCNQSCGICTEPGQGCIKLFCPDGRMPGHE